MPMQPQALAVQLDDLINMTKKGRVEWDVRVKTTEHLADDQKDHIEEEGRNWTIDEVYILFSCQYLNNPFHLISYELLKTSGKDVRSNNLLFMAPNGMRLFQLDYLAPYNVACTPQLVARIHTLWLMILEGAKSGNPKIHLDASEPTPLF